MEDVERRFRVDQTSPLQEIGNALDVGVLALDRSLVVTGWNAWLEMVTGKRAADIVGRPLTDAEPSLSSGARIALEQAVNGATVILSQRLHGYLRELGCYLPPG